MKLIKAVACSLVSAGVLLAQPPASAPDNVAQLPIQIPSFDPTAMDQKADPCSDFYQYSCGGWIANNPIPADQSRWGRFSELAERNRRILRTILEKASANNARRSPLEQKYGDFYAACMDEKAASKKGYKPIQPLLERIEQLRSKDDLAALLAMLHSQAGVNAVFEFTSVQDFKDASQIIAQAGQGGLGLPDRDYYTRTDAKSVEIRKQYVDHMAALFKLLGDTPAQAESEARWVMEIETALANGSLTRVERRDPVNVYHKISTAELAALAPALQWDRYLEASGSPFIQSLNVESPEFFKTVNQEIASVPLQQWKSYLRWHVAHEFAPYLSDALVNESFNFYGKILNGQQENKPRWKRCVALTDRELGEALAQAYVQQNFGADNKIQTLKLVDALEHAWGEDLQGLAWMTPETKAEAEVKLKHIANKIGYPEHWRDYSSVQINRHDLSADLMHTQTFEFHRELAKIGKPVDKDEWLMTPPTVNAYYDRSMNDINFPAGILQYPFFDKNADPAMNYGGIGVVIGHELTHGFDDQGRKFDENGNLRDWWTPEDAQAFEKRAACLSREYSGFSPAPGVNLNGDLTLGENTADNGGLRIAYMALLETLAKDPEAAEKKIDGFTPEQRFFISFAQVWCENRTPEANRRMAITDPHSPGRFRVTGTLQNNEDFAKAFGCKQGQPMVTANACRVW